MNDRRLNDEDVINIVNQNSQRRRAEREYDRYQSTRRNFEEKSRNGSSGRRTRKKENVSSSNFKNRLLVLGLTATMLFGIQQAGSFALDEIQEGKIYHELQDNVRTEYIVDNTHRTNDNEHYWYDYAAIADKLEDSENFDRDLFIMSQNSNYFDMNEVLKYTDYGNLDNYLEAKNFDDKESYVEGMKDYIESSIEIDMAFDEREKELNKMTEESEQIDQFEDQHNLDNGSSHTM